MSDESSRVSDLGDKLQENFYQLVFIAYPEAHKLTPSDPGPVICLCSSVFNDDWKIADDKPTPATCPVSVVSVATPPENARGDAYQCRARIG